MVGWSEFGILLGVAAAILIGTLLVALTIRADTLDRTVDGRVRAVHALGLLLTVLVTGAVLTVVRQPPGTLGVELVVLGAVAGTAAVLLDRRARPRADQQAAVRVFDVGTPNLIVAALLAAAGISLTAGEEGGLYLAVVAALGALVGAVLGAWRVLLARPGQAGPPPPRQPEPPVAVHRPAEHPSAADHGTGAQQVPRPPG